MVSPWDRKWPNFKGKTNKTHSELSLWALKCSSWLIVYYIYLYWLYFAYLSPGFYIVNTHSQRICNITWKDAEIFGSTKRSWDWSLGSRGSLSSHLPHAEPPPAPTPAQQRQNVQNVLLFPARLGYRPTQRLSYQRFASAGGFLSLPECQGIETRLDVLSHSSVHCGDTNGSGVGVWAENNFSKLNSTSPFVFHSEISRCSWQEMYFSVTFTQ